MSERRADVVTIDGDGSRWEYATRAAAPNVARWVGPYAGYKQWCPAPQVRREVSGTRIPIILDLGPPIAVTWRHGSARYADGFVAGLHERYAETAHEGYQEGVQLDVSPVVARALLGIPMCELTDQVVGLDDLRFERNLTDRLRELRTWDQRFDHLDALFARRFAALDVPSRVTQWAVDHITRAGGDVDIAALARDLGYSTKHVVRLFREHVGVGPKHFARLVRFERMLHLADADLSRSWADLAVVSGYYDQAHLVREVKGLTGLTPTELRAERGDAALLQERLSLVA